MPYDHICTNCFADAIGPNGLGRDVFEAALGETPGALAALAAARDDNSLPLLRLPAAVDDLAELQSVADRFRAEFDDVVVLGTGGSSLGGQTICALADRGFGPLPGAPRIWFMDNVDPDTFEVLQASLDLGRTGFLVISKSGSTAETLTQLLICMEAVSQRSSKDLGHHFTAVTEPGDNVLRRLAARHAMPTLDHDPGVGGRYSALSLVGLLPTMMAGLDGGAVRRGAGRVLDQALSGSSPQDMPPAVGAAISVGLLRQRGVATTVLMPYVDRLAHFGLWYRQLWAESLGKDGTGTTPIRAVGTVDQHSQLQLYLAGPADKMFTVVMLDCAGSGATVDAKLAGDEALGYLRGRTMGDLMDAEQRATAETLARNGRPTRVIRLARLDEAVMGELMMHYMLETIIAAHLLGVDPFDQPAVEEGKVLTRSYLAAMTGGG
jgi:glucose-6-phosphate isomerase